MALPVYLSAGHRTSDHASCPAQVEAEGFTPDQAWELNLPNLEDGTDHEKSL